MPAYHVTLFFAQPPKWGWREQFWWEGGDQHAALVAGQQLAAARYSILGAGVSLYRVSVAIPAQPRCSSSAPVSGVTTPYLPMPAVAALRVRLLGTGSPPHRRSYVLGGLPAGSIDGAKGVTIAPQIAGPLAAWLALLLRGGWRLLANQPLGPALQVLGITAAADGEDRDIYGAPLVGPAAIGQQQLLWVATAGSPPPVATSARIWGVQVLPKIPRLARQVNGERVLLATWATGFYCQGSTYGIDHLAGGQVVFYSRALVPISSAEPQALVGRKCGPGAHRVDSTPPRASGPVTPFLGATPAGVPPLPQPPPPVVPVLNTYQTARDLVVEVFKGYSLIPGSHQKTVGLAQASNQAVDTWVVFVPGVDVGSFTDNFSEWVSGLEAWLGVEDRYTAFVEQVLSENVPAGARVFYTGHSLGGMAVQWARANRNEVFRNGAVNLIGFGCPVFASPYPSLTAPVGTLAAIFNAFQQSYAPRDARYFGYRLDPCTYLSPGGFWAWLRLLSIMGTLGQGAAVDLMLATTYFPWTDLVTPPAGVLPNLFRLHMTYPDNPELNLWNWSGASDPGKTLPPLTTGPVQRFTYVP